GLLKTWLKTWDIDQTINGFVVPARPNIRTVLIEPWKARDGQAGVSDEQWEPNWRNAPFRLLAIVNRLDLKRDAGGIVQNAGEGRFVFCVTAGAGVDSPELPFTVI